MVSILIPAYNYDVTQLVFELHHQIEHMSVDAEIIVLEDGSKDDAILAKNKETNALSFCKHHLQKENTGRARVRNSLAKMAQYDFLLFIDGDSLVEKNYLENYLKAIDEATAIIYGGRKHPKNYGNKSNLRWQYGTHIEDKTAKERRKKPYRSTVYNNTLVKKTVFEQVAFEDALSQYGHEDTLLSYQFKKRGTHIKHIDNPVVHNEIDSNAVFLSKTISGLENLKKLYQNNKIDPGFVKITKTYLALKKFGLDRLFGVFYSIFKNPLRRNLTGKKPSLFVFSIFKLSYFCKINT